MSFRDITVNRETTCSQINNISYVHFILLRFLENLPDLEELESKLTAYYALEKESKRSVKK